MEFGDLTYEVVRAYARRGAAVFVPLGCTEQQGPHLPVDFDTWMVTALCLAVAERVRAEHGRLVLVLPALPFGPTPEHTGFGGGYINLRQATHEAIAQDILGSLAEQGFLRLFLWRGCGQHDLGAVIARFNASRPDARAFQPVIDYPAIAREAFGGEVPGGHADSFATSLCLLLRPDAVRAEQIRRPVLAPFTWRREMDFAAISDTGVIGDPTQADTGTGARIWARVIESGARITVALLDDPDAGVRQEWRLE